MVEHWAWCFERKVVSCHGRHGLFCKTNIVESTCWVRPNFLQTNLAAATLYQCVERMISSGGHFKFHWCYTFSKMHRGVSNIWFFSNPFLCLAFGMALDIGTTLCVCRWQLSFFQFISVDGECLSKDVIHAPSQHRFLVSCLNMSKHLWFVAQKAEWLSWCFRVHVFHPSRPK